MCRQPNHLPALSVQSGFEWLILNTDSLALPAKIFDPIWDGAPESTPAGPARLGLVRVGGDWSLVD